MPICRLFNSPSDAQSAANDLAEAGFGSRHTTLVDSTGGYYSVTALVRKGIEKARAKSYAEAIRQGATLVIVEPPFGFAKRATDALAGAAVTEGAGDTHYEGQLWDENTPASSAFGLPVLLNNDSTFSSWFGLPLLAKSQSPKVRISTSQKAKSTFGFPLLTKSQNARSTFGIPLLIKSK